MTEADSPSRNFTTSDTGYDRNEVDAYVAELQSELRELRQRAEQGESGARDVRLHDPEGAVQRTLAVAQEAADRVLHDAQVEADRRRTESEEQASASIADAEARASKMMADVEAQTAEMRAQGVAAARSAIQVERDRAVAELGQIRRVRDDIRAEAVELKAVLDRYSVQARDASDALAAASTGPLVAVDLPEFVAADVALAGVVDDDEPELVAVDLDDSSDDVAADAPAASADDVDSEDPNALATDAQDTAMADVEAIDTDATLTWASDLDDEIGTDAADGEVDPPLADVIAIDGDGDDPSVEAIDLGDSAGYDDLPSDLDDTQAGSGAFLSEIQSAADPDEPVVDLVDNAADDSDRFLAELRGVADAADDADGASGQFFDVD